jgi:hypothetical protein
MTTVEICLSYIHIQDDLGLVYENNGKYICTVENGIRDRTGKYLNQQGEITVNIEGM